MNKKIKKDANMSSVKNDESRESRNELHIHIYEVKLEIKALGLGEKYVCTHFLFLSSFNAYHIPIKGEISRICEIRNRSVYAG